MLSLPETHRVEIQTSGTPIGILLLDSGRSTDERRATTDVHTSAGEPT